MTVVEVLYQGDILPKFLTRIYEEDKANLMNDFNLVNPLQYAIRGNRLTSISKLTKVFKKKLQTMSSQVKLWEVLYDASIHLKEDRGNISDLFSDAKNDDNESLYNTDELSGQKDDEARTINIGELLTFRSQYS